MRPPGMMITDFCVKTHIFVITTRLAAVANIFISTPVSAMIAVAARSLTPGMVCRRSYLGFKLVDLNVLHKKDVWQVKAVIKSEKGVGIKDCTSVHRTLQPRIEALIGSQDVTMEVSSPGINRLVKRAVEFYAFVGEEAQIWDNSITDWRHGIIKEVNSEGLVLNSDNQDIQIPYQDIKKARCNL